MYNDADVETYAARLRSADSAARALAADEATDGVSDWGQHAYTPTQADHITHALVDALEVQSSTHSQHLLSGTSLRAARWFAPSPCLDLTRIRLPRTGGTSRSGFVGIRSISERD